MNGISPQYAVFSLNFSSADKGPFTAGEAKNMHHRGALFRRQAGIEVWEMPPLLLGNLGAKFSEMSFPYFKTYFTQISHCYPVHNKLKRFILIMSPMFSFENVWPIKRKAVYT